VTPQAIPPDRRQPVTLRILLLIEEGGIFSGRFCTDVLTGLSDEIQAVCLVEGRAGVTGLLPVLLANFRHVGLIPLLKLAAVVAAKRVMAHLPPALVGVANSSVARIARHFGKPLLRLGNLNSPETYETLASFRPDLLITSVSTILREPLLSLPPLGCLNRHASLLPSYGGLFPVFQAVAHGEQRVGVTAHLMTEQIDGGPILWQVEVPIQKGDTVWSLYSRCYQLAGECVVRAVEVLKGLRPPRRIEPPPAPSYYSLPTPEHWHLFRRRGIPFA